MQSFTIHTLASIYELRQQELDLRNTISAYNYSAVCLMISYKLLLNAIWNTNWKQLANSIYISHYNCNSSQNFAVPNTTTILSITLVFFDSLLFSIVLKPTMLHCPLYLKTKLNPNLRFTGFRDKHMINLKQVSRCADCTLTGRQTEQNINYRRCSKNNARRVGLVTGSAVFVYETWISCGEEVAPWPFVRLLSQSTLKTVGC